jgi:hypothetical protein
LDHSLRLGAEPAGSTAIQAADGSVALVCWFLQERDQLEISMEARVRALRTDPSTGSSPLRQPNGCRP